MANYNKLATLMGEHQDLATFRRFQKLNLKSLLGMQAEILHLECELATIEREDERAQDDSRSSLHKSMFNLKTSGGSTHDYQWRKVLEVREKLAQYSKLGTTRLGLVSTNAVRGSRQRPRPLFARSKTPQSLHPGRSHTSRVAGSA